MIPGSPEPERGFVLAVLAQGLDAEDQLAEVRELARTAGVEPVGAVVQRRARPAQRTYVGKGKLGELKERFSASDAESVIVDDELDPAQQRYLENTLNARIVDRTQLILDIFAQHAVTAEGKLQVELAQLEYNLPRMRGMWQHLERLGGGTGGLGAGVGTRGPGESQLETDRRLARRRVSILKRRLQELERQGQAVEDVLAEIGAAELPLELVLNKIALVDEVGRRRLANRFPGAPQVSASSGEGLDRLRARVAEHFGSRWQLVRLLVPYDEGSRLSELYGLGAPIDEREDTADGVLVVARLPRRELQRFAPYLIAEAHRETA